MASITNPESTKPICETVGDWGRVFFVDEMSPCRAVTFISKSRNVFSDLCIFGFKDGSIKLHAYLLQTAPLEKIQAEVEVLRKTGLDFSFERFPSISRISASKSLTELLAIFLKYNELESKNKDLVSKLTSARNWTHITPHE